MGLLAKYATASLVFLAGCYEPELRDCTVTCSGESDCASGQVCGSDHMCAAPDVAGHCDRVMAVVDAGVIVDGTKPMPDAPPPPPDAPTPHGQLHVTVDGQGRVTIEGIGTCTKDCTYSVPLATQITAQAVAQDHWRFERWTQGPCIGQQAGCTFTSALLVVVNAKFKKD